MHLTEFNTLHLNENISVRMSQFSNGAALLTFSLARSTVQFDTTKEEVHTLATWLFEVYHLPVSEVEQRQMETERSMEDAMSDDDIKPDARSVAHYAEVLREKGYGISAGLMEQLLAEREAALSQCRRAVENGLRFQAERDAARAEVARLREALEKIADRSATTDAGRSIARAALAAKEPGHE